MDSIYRATPSHLHQARRVLREARQRFTNFGDEDLASLLRDEITIIGAANARPWGVMSLQRERNHGGQSSTARAYLRGVALMAGRSPIVDVPRLVTTMSAQLPPLTPLQAIIYSDGWLVAPLKAAGFVLVDRLQFMELTHLQSRQPASSERMPVSGIRLRYARPDDLSVLAQVDAEVFAPVWRLATQELTTLLLAGRVQLAIRDDQLLGYSALSMQTISSTQHETQQSAQLARLAVHPAAQGAGIGRLLLIDVIDYARANQADSLLLNTQSSNVRSLALYHAFGFRNTGKITPVLARTFDHDINGGLI